MNPFKFAYRNETSDRKIIRNYLSLDNCSQYRGQPSLARVEDVDADVRSRDDGVTLGHREHLSGESVSFKRGQTAEAY
ncbi:hypothetical protein, partial [Rhodococcus sp. LB1]|uniref:hypothetical protein n=1 Tax=Rhodococcus sp. LB1 TaxID=1807499 RepID=UPI001E5E45E5